MSQIGARSPSRCGRNGAGRAGSDAAARSEISSNVRPSTQAEPERVARARDRDGNAAERDPAAIGLRFVHQELNVLPRLSVAENLFLGHAYPTRWRLLVDWSALRRRASEALAALGVSDITPDAIVGSLSVGDRMIVKIASTFLGDGDHPGRIFVMDEPTAALTARESERLFQTISELKRRGCGVIYVSHRIEEILQVCDRITVLRDGVSQPPIASAATTRAALIERMTGRATLGTAPPARPAAGRPAALTVDRLRGDGIEDISFELEPGEILGLAGLSDAGADRLLRAMMGGMTGGTVSVGGKIVRPCGPAEGWRRGFAYVPSERRTEGLLMSHDIASNVALPHLRKLARFGFVLDRTAERAKAEEVGRRARLRAVGPRQRTWRLSGGNQQKVMFARAVAGSPSVLLLDEPTRGVDVGAKFEIHALLREIAAKGASIVVSSSDHEELIALTGRIAILVGGASIASCPPRG